MGRYSKGQKSKVKSVVRIDASAWNLCRADLGQCRARAFLGQPDVPFPTFVRPPFENPLLDAGSTLTTKPCRSRASPFFAMPADVRCMVLLVAACIGSPFALTRKEGSETRSLSRLTLDSMRFQESLFRLAEIGFANVALCLGQFELFLEALQTTRQPWTID